MSSVPPSALVPVTRVVTGVEPRGFVGPRQPSIFTSDGRTYWNNVFTSRRYPTPVTPLPLPLPASGPVLSLPAPVVAEEPVVTVEEPATPEPLVTIEPVDRVIRIPRSVPAPAPAPRPAPRPSRTIQRIRRERGEAAERRALRAERRPKRTKFTCRVCDVSCNSRRALVDHKASRRHRNRVASAGKQFICHPCEREFDTETHLQRHQRGKYHLRVVSNL